MRIAIRDSDTAAFTKVPGIGKKTAQRILLELAGKLVIEQDEDAAPGSPVAAAEPASPTQEEVRAALSSLGWTEKDAAAAVEAALKAEPQLAEADTPTLLRSTLRSLGSGRTGGGR